MNKYKAIILSLLIGLVGTTTSCEDWLYENINEDAAHEVLPEQVFPIVLFYSAQMQFDHADYGIYLSQYFTTGGRSQTSSLAYKAGWGDFLTMKEINPDLAFCLPEEGTNLYVDAMCIPKNAENKENAEIFINYMCSTAAGLKNCEEIWYSSPLLSVREELDPEVSGDPYAYPDESILSKCESFKNLPAETLALYDSEWTRLMLASN